MIGHWDFWMSKHHMTVKQRCRKGIPNSVRGLAWQKLCGADVLCVNNTGKYGELVAEADRWVQELDCASCLSLISHPYSVQIIYVKTTLCATLWNLMPKKLAHIAWVWTSDIRSEVVILCGVLCALPCVSLPADHPLQQYLEIIDRDLDRTFPHNERFSIVGGEGQKELRVWFIEYEIATTELHVLLTWGRLDTFCTTIYHSHRKGCYVIITIVS